MTCLRWKSKNTILPLVSTVHKLPQRSLKWVSIDFTSIRQNKSNWDLKQLGIICVKMSNDFGIFSKSNWIVLQHIICKWSMQLLFETLCKFQLWHQGSIHKLLKPVPYWKFRLLLFWHPGERLHIPINSQYSTKT